MDVAEQLFAERGLEAVSLRTVNGEAGYSVAALHYHFGTREGLVQALLTRSQPPMLERRERMLAALRASREPPPLERIVEALVMPLAQSVLEDPERGSRAMRFLARLYFDHSPHMATVLDDSLTLFLPLLRRALPGMDRRTLVKRWSMAAELTLSVASRVPSCEDGLSPAGRADLEGAFAELVKFIVGGLRNGPED
jgi:AcrR family transcriptional regulator